MNFEKMNLICRIKKIINELQDCKLPDLGGIKVVVLKKMDEATLKMAVSEMADKSTTVLDVAKRLHITTTTIYMYLNGDGSLKEPGYKRLYKI